MSCCLRSSDRKVAAAGLRVQGSGFRVQAGFKALRIFASLREPCDSQANQTVGIRVQQRSPLLFQPLNNLFETSLFANPIQLIIAFEFRRVCKALFYRLSQRLDRPTLIAL